MRVALKKHWQRALDARWLVPCLLISGLVLTFAIAHFGLLNNYIQLVLIYVGINIILATSLNLVNGYMGEFSLAHAGFMAVGAYSSALLSMKVLPVAAHPALFHLAVLAGGLVTALLGLLVALPSFKVRGDYLAIVTLAFLMIVKSALENIDAIGGPRGISGIPRLTTLPWVFCWTVALLWLIRNFVYSCYGRGVLAIREDEIASDLMSVDTRRVKVLAFMLSAFCAGIAGALFAHLLQFISPRVFDVVKTTEILIMVYLGGIASIGGSILGAALYTLLLELLRPSTVAGLLSWLPAVVFDPLNDYFIRHLGVLRMIIMPLALVLVMLFWPRGILGLREFRGFIPRRDRRAHGAARLKGTDAHDVADSHSTRET
ncbi:MAG: branched-chain amino acid ABC transporter permease [Verrucomicrobiota bacterium]